MDWSTVVHIDIGRYHIPTLREKRQTNFLK